MDISFAERTLYDRALVLADGDGGVHGVVEHATLLAQRGTDAPCEFRKVIGLRQELVRKLPLALAGGVLPFGLAVAQRAGPMAERYAAVHAPGSLEHAVALVEGLLHFSEIGDSFKYRPVAGFLTGDGQERIRVSHIPYPLIIHLYIVDLLVKLAQLFLVEDSLVFDRRDLDEVLGVF